MHISKSFSECLWNIFERITGMPLRGHLLAARIVITRLNDAFKNHHLENWCGIAMFCSLHALFFLSCRNCNSLKVSEVSEVSKSFWMIGNFGCFCNFKSFHKFPKVSKSFQKFPKVSESFRKLPKVSGSFQSLETYCHSDWER